MEWENEEILFREQSELGFACSVNMIKIEGDVFYEMGFVQ